jgi:hypothetical protein
LEKAERVVDHDPDSEEVAVVDVTPAGLSPAEHASLRWTHNRTRNFHNFSLETPKFFDDLYLRLANAETPPGAG